MYRPRLLSAATITTSSSGTPIGPLLLTVFACILEVFILCVAGYILAKKDILDKKTQKQLNRLNVSLFTPSLLFSKVAFFLSPAKLRELWIIPIFFVIVTTLSMVVAFILGTIFRLKKSQRSFAMAAAMFMNSNSLPIALMQSLVVTVPELKWDDDDNKNVMLGRALTYLVLYSTLGMVVRWSFGVRLLAQADDEGTQASADEERVPLLVDEPPTGITGDTGPGLAVPVRERNGRPNPPVRRTSRFYNSFPNSPNQSRVNLAGTETPSTAESTCVSPSPVNSDSEEEPLTLPIHERRVSFTRHHRQPRSSLHWVKRRAYHFWVGFNDFMTVPLWAAVLSIVVACIQPLQHALDVHATPIKGALASAGNCSIPITLIVLGGYFYQPPAENAPKLPLSTSHSSLFENVRKALQPKRKSTQDQKAEAGETKTVVIGILSRMVITPLLLLPLMALFTTYDVQKVFADPVFVVSNVLLISSPPALTLAQITQAASGDAFERLISRTVFWSYCVVTPPATIFYVLVGLILAKL